MFDAENFCDFILQNKALAYFTFICGILQLNLIVRTREIWANPWIETIILLCRSIEISILYQTPVKHVCDIWKHTYEASLKKLSHNLFDCQEVYAETAGEYLLPIRFRTKVEVDNNYPVPKRLMNPTYLQSRRIDPFHCPQRTPLYRHSTLFV